MTYEWIIGPKISPAPATVLEIRIPVEPVPLERARTVRLKENGKVRTFTPDRSMSYRQIVQAYARIAIAAARWRASRTARYAVTIEVTSSDRRARDLSNVAKALEDSLNGIAWGDDSQIDRLDVRRMPVSKKPGAVVRIQEIRG